MNDTELESWRKQVTYLNDDVRELNTKIADALKELDVYCDGCSRFKNNKCVLKKAWACQILKIRMILANERMDEKK